MEDSEIYLKIKDYYNNNNYYIDEDKFKDLINKICTDDYSYIMEKYDDMIKTKNFYYVYVYINNYDELIIKKDIIDAVYKPNNQYSDHSIKYYSKDEISQEKIDELIEKLYGESLTRLEFLEDKIKLAREAHNKSFKQLIRKKKIRKLYE